MATTSDGLNIMKNFGSPSKAILWFNYAIHLGVVNTFYKKNLAFDTRSASTREDTVDSDNKIMENKNLFDEEKECNVSFETNCPIRPIDEVIRVDENRFSMKILKKLPLKTVNTEM